MSAPRDLNWFHNDILHESRSYSALQQRQRDRRCLTRPKAGNSSEDWQFPKEQLLSKNPPEISQLGLAIRARESIVFLRIVRMRHPRHARQSSHNDTSMTTR